MIPHYWEFVYPYIQDALEFANGELTPEDVKEYLLAERMFLFIAQRKLICGAVTCEVVQYDRKKAIRVVTLGGKDFDQWREQMQDELRAWMERIGADGIECYVRQGLVPQLEKLGYKQLYVGMWYGQKKRD